MEKVKSDYINPDKYNFIIDLMRPDNANALRICLYTGLRINDVLSLRKEDLSADGTVRTVCSKTKKNFEGKVPVKLAGDILRRSRKNSQWLFPSPLPRRSKDRGERLRVDRHRTRQAVWANIKRAARHCAEPRNVTPHSARKIYAVEQFHKYGLEEAQKSLQHDRTATTLIYAFSDLLTAEKKKTAPPPVSAADESYFADIEQRSHDEESSCAGNVTAEAHAVIYDFLRGLLNLAAQDENFVSNVIAAAPDFTDL